MSRRKMPHRRRRQTADASTLQEAPVPGTDGKTAAKRLRPFILPAVIVAAAVCAVAAAFAILRLTESNPVLERLPKPPSFKGEVPGLEKTVKAAYKAVRKTVYSDPTDKDWAEAVGRLADVYLSNNYYDQAEQCYEFALELDPNNAVYSYRLAYLLRTKGQNEPVIELLERTVRNCADYLPAHLALGDVCFKAGRTDDAIKHYQNCLALSPNDPWALQGLARIAMARDQWEAAQQYLETAITAAPDFAGLHRLMAQVHEHFGREAEKELSLKLAKPMAWRFHEAPDPWIENLHSVCYKTENLLLYIRRAQYRYDLKTAQDLFKWAMEIDPRNTELYLRYGIFLYEAGRPLDSLKQFAKIFEIDPKHNDPYTLYSYGTALAKSQRDAEAIACFEKCLASNPSFYQSYNEIGLIKMRQQKFDEAIANLEKTLEINPTVLEAHNNLAVLYERLGKYELAIEHCVKAFEIDPRVYEPHKNYGLIMMELGRYEDAAEHMRTALEINPNANEVRSSLAAVLAKQAKYDEAVRVYEELLKLEPRAVGVHTSIGAIYAEQGRCAEAISSFEKELKAKPDYANALNRLAWIKATAADAAFRDPEAAVKMASQACEMTRYGNPTFMDTLACAHAAAGNFNEAVRIERAAVDAARSAGNNAQIPEIDRRLNSFLAGKPYMEDLGR